MTRKSIWRKQNCTKRIFRRELSSAMNVVGASRSLSERLGACYLPSGVPFGTPLDKHLPCLELLGASRSFSEPLTCQVAYHLVGHLPSTHLAWGFGTSRSFSELHGTSRSFSDPLGASYLASGLPFGTPPDKYPPCPCPAPCLLCLLCLLLLPLIPHSACSIALRAQTLAEFSPERAKRGPPPQAAYRAKRGSRRRRPAPKAPPSLARAANES